MNLLVTGAWSGAKEYIPALEKMGHAVAFMQYETDELPCSGDWVEGVVCNGLFLHHAIESFPNLRCIQLTSAGFDRVPMDFVRANGIEIRNARGVYSAPMAEYAISGVLQLYKQAAFFRENQKRRRWEKHRGLRELSGKTVCIVGCGSVGSECAKRFQAFGCRVIGIATEKREQAFFDEVRPVAELDNVLPEADVVVLCVPLTGRSTGLMNADRIAQMKHDAVLVNISRGAIADEAALTEALRKGCIGGAVLDVFEDEPLNEESPLWNTENVIVTPHNSFVGEGNGTRLTEVILEQLMKS